MSTNTMTFIESPAQMPTGISKGRPVQNISHRQYEDGREVYVCNFCNREAERFHQILGHISQHTAPYEKRRPRNLSNTDVLAAEIAKIIRESHKGGSPELQREVKRLAAQVNSLKTENRELKKRLAAFEKFRDLFHTA